MDELTLAMLPAHFARVRYQAAQVPDGSHDLSRGANCQRFAYAVLAHFGIELPPLRSSEVWVDEQFSTRVDNVRPLDLLLFNRTADAFGAHVAVYAGAGQALHLSKAVGHPALWSLAEFADQPAYAVLIGGKRILR